MIFYLMGKSAVGKDTLFKKIMCKCPYLKMVITYTTRPKRENEQDGVDYYFVNEDFLDNNKNIIIEKRLYKTVYGNWYYATLDNQQINNRDNYLMIGTLVSYESMKRYFGEKNIFPLYIEIPYELRYERAISRAKNEKKSMLAEIQRRLQQDEIDFSDKNLKLSNITKRYNNIDSDILANEISKIIENNKC